MGFLHFIGNFKKIFKNRSTRYGMMERDAAGKGETDLEFRTALQKQLENKGFYPVRNQEDWYWRAENPILYLVCVEYGTAARREKAAAFAKFSQRMLGSLKQLHCTKIIALHISVDNNKWLPSVEDVDNVDIADYDERIYPVFWQYSTESGKIVAPQGQPDRILGIEKLLLAAARGEEVEALPLWEGSERKLPVGAVGILLFCLAALLWMLVSGQRGEIIHSFGMSRAGIAEGEYYRFLTCMFLHSGWMHLASNSIYLYYFGFRTERLLGTGRFLLLYLVSGVCGSLCSILLGNGGLSIGASGAIYGLLGAMLLLTKKRGAVYTEMNYATMLLLAVSAICLGFLEPGVDNLAHIGGFLGGIAVFGAFLRKKVDK